MRDSKRILTTCALLLLTTSAESFQQDGWQVSMSTDKMTDKQTLVASVQSRPAASPFVYELTLRCDGGSNRPEIATYDDKRNGREMPWKAEVLGTTQPVTVDSLRFRYRVDSGSPTSSKLVREKYPNVGRPLGVENLLASVSVGVDFLSSMPTSRVVVADIFPNEQVEFRFDTLKPTDRKTVQDMCFAAADRRRGEQQQEQPKPKPGNGITDPILIHEVKPKYTRDAMRAKLEGVVEMDAVVRSDGTIDPTSLKITRSLDATFGLDEEAKKAVRQWKFRPAMCNRQDGCGSLQRGQPVSVLVSVELTFTLGK